MKKLLITLFASGSAFAFYPFTGEDTQTLGGFGKLQWELQGSYFKNYGNLKHTDIVNQLTLGVKENIDVAIIIPYIIQSNGEKVSGFSDSSVFIKHILFKNQNLGLGYKLQVNFDTGKKELGYGKTTYNLNLMFEYNIENTTLNINGVYNKFSHVGEDLRDTKGIVLGLYQSLRENIKVGGEFRYLEHESKSVDKKDTHILLGAVYSPLNNIDLSFGVHKSLNKHQDFANYGILVGIAYRF